MAKLTENLIREISSVRNEPQWLLQWRLDAFCAWQKMQEPHWAEFDYTPIDYDSLNYYNEPGTRREDEFTRCVCVRAKAITAENLSVCKS